MNITEIKITQVEGDDRLKAVATLIIDSKYEFHGFKIIQGDNRLYVQFPRDKKKNKLFVPLTTNAQETIERKIRWEYWQLRNNAKNRN